MTDRARFKSGQALAYVYYQGKSPAVDRRRTCLHVMRRGASPSTSPNCRSCCGGCEAGDESRKAKLSHFSTAAQSELFDTDSESDPAQSCAGRSPARSRQIIGHTGAGERAAGIEDRRVVARRLFEAMCAQFPEKYISLIQPRGVADEADDATAATSSRSRHRSSWRSPPASRQHRGA